MSLERYAKRKAQQLKSSALPPSVPMPGQHEAASVFCAQKIQRLRCGAGSQAIAAPRSPTLPAGMSVPLRMLERARIQQLLAQAASSALTRPRGWGKAEVNTYLNPVGAHNPEGRVAAVQRFVQAKSSMLQCGGQHDEALALCDPVILLSELVAAVGPIAVRADEESHAQRADAALASTRAREAALQQLRFSQLVRAEYDRHEHGACSGALLSLS